MKRGLCALLLIAFLSSTYAVGVFAATRAEQLTESIKEKEAQISSAKNQKATINSSLTDVKKIKAQLESQKADLAAYVTQLDASLTDIQTKIEELNNLVSEKEEEICKTEEELAQAQELEKQQYEAMKLRMKFIYESRSAGGYLEMMLNSDSFGELLNKADYIEALSDYDARMLDEYVKNEQLIRTCKEELDAQKEVLVAAKDQQEQEQAALEDLISTKESEITAYQSDINNKEAAIKEYEQMIAAQDAAIKELEALVAEERKALAAETARKYDGGMFTWPAPSYTRISDDYGYRTHPILGVQQFHNGIDMASPSGSPILAAYDGEVVAAAYSSTMGNYIMINHGDSLYTIYMHASALYVSKGDVVSKGQKIAAVGSTGRSTGPHLHFSVRINGEYVSPWQYLGH
ncbi:MAG: peptidoglycan DD-metalloendopeptidase family protein [Lachnospiraceae bacterium]|nr:peptidoglycan DD-metalloendopeptidase family protein [Lachnospiraceae bacterium]